jgi:hypothetical protein
MARVLLDESLPRQLAPLLVGHDVQTVRQAGWAGLSNGELLRQAATRFDVLATGDKSMQYQQNLPAIKIGLVIVVSRDNRVEAGRCALGAATARAVRRFAAAHSSPHAYDHGAGGRASPRPAAELNR